MIGTLIIGTRWASDAKRPINFVVVNANNLPAGQQTLQLISGAIAI